MRIVSTLLAATGIVAMAAAAQAAESYRIGGGPAGGGWHPSVSAGRGNNENTIILHIAGIWLFDLCHFYTP